MPNPRLKNNSQPPLDDLDAPYVRGYERGLNDGHEIASEQRQLNFALGLFAGYILGALSYLFLTNL